MSSLLHHLRYPHYKEALEFSKQKCQDIADLAKLRISFDDAKVPGELLINALDRGGYTVENYHKYLQEAAKLKTTYYKPQFKVALLIANDRYQNLTNLASPSLDCDSLAANLKSFGFIIVTIKNSKSEDLKTLIKELYSIIPEDSYCFVFYAGHGCELGNIKCILDVGCPVEDIDMTDCVSDYYILQEVAKCNPAHCFLIMDTCCLDLDRERNPKIYSKVAGEGKRVINKNFLIVYSAQSYEAAYEILQVDCSKTISGSLYDLKSGETNKVLGGSSQYVNALCTWIKENLDISSMVDKVHEEMENSSAKTQIPIKIQRGVMKKSMYDPAQGNPSTLLPKIKEIIAKFDNCDTF